MCNTKEHKLAEVLRAIADGFTIQCKATNFNRDEWKDLDVSGNFSIVPSWAYRIKHNPKVKKYRWLLRDSRNKHHLSVSMYFYKDLIEANGALMRGYCVPVEPILSTMQEFDE